MDVRNYRRFRKLARRLPERYYVQNFRTAPTMPAVWTKIRVNGTTVTPKNEPITDTHAGACLDIFPMAGRAGTKTGRAIRRWALPCMKTLMHKDDRRNAPWPLRRMLAGILERAALKMADSSELDCLICNDPVGYADLILNGDPEAYLRQVKDYHPLDA